MATTAASSAVSPTPPHQGASRPQVKTAGPGPNSGVGNATNRRAMQSPVDSGPRRNSSHKPWGGANQNQQARNQGPNVSNQPRPSESDTPDKHMHDRLLFLFVHLIGSQVIVTLKSGEQITGIYGGGSTESGDVGALLNFAKQIKDGQEEYIGAGPQKTAIIEPKDLMSLSALNINLGDLEPVAQNGASSFKTDVDISGNQPVRERELRRWDDKDAPAATGLGLEDAALESPTNGEWDQFQEAEKRFGKVSDYSEEIYTTKIDRSHPDYKEREAKAERIAREIMGGGNGQLTAHQAEERNIVFGDDSGVDEEDKYSGVQRQPANPSIYTPPAMRAAQAQPKAVPGVPNDPAIISSRLAKPETSASTTASKSIPKQTPVIPIPQITKEAPSPRPPSTSSFKKDDVKPEEKPTLADALKKTVATPAVPALPTMKPLETNAASATLAAGPPNPTANNAIKGTRDAFKQFVVSEREKADKSRKAIAKKDKDSKLSDLRRFAQEFKLRTLVPQDLVPILAKDKGKQDEIVRKAAQNAASSSQKVVSPTSSISSSTTKAPSATTSTTVLIGPGQVQQLPQPTSNQHGQQQQPIDRNGFNKMYPRERMPQYGQQHSGNFRDNRGVQMPPNMHLPTGPGQRNLSAKILENQRLQKAGQYVPLPPPMPIMEHQSQLPAGPSSTANTSAATSKAQALSNNRLNVNAKAFEFKPNPAAATFTPFSPGSQATSPIVPSPAVTTRAASPSMFFGDKKPVPESERQSIKDNFNPFKKTSASGKASSKASGGKHVLQPGVFDKPYLTPPVWPVDAQNQDKKYTDLFTKVENGTPDTFRAPQGPAAAVHGPQHLNMPHLPHIPPQPHGAQQHNPPQHVHQTPPHMPGSQAHFTDSDHHIRQMGSPPPVMPSPHLQTAAPAPFASPASHYAMLHGGHQGPMQPGYNMNGPNSQFQNYRAGFGGPQFMPPSGAPGGAAMMMGQHGQPPMQYMITSPYMSHGMPQTMYSPQQMHLFPGQPGGAPPPPSSAGYPSPGRGAPMMIHQGSQQGQNGPTTMMMSMSNGPAGHPQQHQMMRQYPAPSQFGHQPHQPHHPQQHHHYPQGPGRGQGGAPHSQPHIMPHHPSQQQIAPPPATIPPQQQGQESKSTDS